MKADNTGIFNFYHVPGLPGLEWVKGTNVTHSFPRHIHRNYCIGIIDQGCRSYYFNGAINYISAGGSLWINPGEVHTCNTAGEKSQSYRMLCLEPDYMRKLLADGLHINPDIPFYIKTSIIGNVTSYILLANLFALLEHAPEESDFILKIEGRLLDTLARLLQGQEYVSTFPNKDESKVISLVREFLETHYMENVSIDQIAQMAGLSPYYLIRTFRKKVGLSPHNFQTQIRVKQAKYKLLQGQPIIDVALETGFTDQSHFTRFFKRIIGLTPGQYINNQTN